MLEREQRKFSEMSSSNRSFQILLWCEEAKFLIVFFRPNVNNGGDVATELESWLFYSFTAAFFLPQISCKNN